MVSLSAPSSEMFQDSGIAQCEPCFGLNGKRRGIKTRSGDCQKLSEINRRLGEQSSLAHYYATEFYDTTSNFTASTNLQHWGAGSSVSLYQQTTRFISLGTRIAKPGILKNLFPENLKL